jgi:CRP-like cAMP-binding protein
MTAAAFSRVDARRRHADPPAMAQEGRKRPESHFTLSEETDAEIDRLAAQHLTKRARILEAAVAHFGRMATVAQANAIRGVDPNYGRGPGAVLALLRERGPLSRADIAAALGLPIGTAASTLTRLVARGMVRHDGEYGGTYSAVPDSKEKRRK